MGFISGAMMMDNGMGMVAACCVGCGAETELCEKCKGKHWEDDPGSFYGKRFCSLCGGDGYTITHSDGCRVYASAVRVVGNHTQPVHTIGGEDIWVERLPDEVTDYIMGERHGE